MMLTVEDLDVFLDQLGDLERDGNPLELAVEATGLLENNNLVQRFLMQRRAALAFDACYLDGETLSAIARACGKTTQTVRLWLQGYGPRRILTLGEEPDAAGRARLVLRTVDVLTDDKAMKRRVRKLRGEGRRIVPARYNLVDDAAPLGYRPGTDAAALWEQLQ